MCGIAGIIGSLQPGDKESVIKMNLIQTHRGPDTKGIRCYSKAILGHRRLKVIDLSDRAQQPIESKDGRHVLVFNGEIYNYKDLRNRLKNSYDFISDSDTEVLLASFQIWGEKCLNYLEGMYAFCIYNVTDGTAFFARDRFGQKPLFFHESNNRLIFGSEIKSLLATGVDANPDMNTWNRYLVSASYDDDDSTFFKNINQLLPGEMAHWIPGKGLHRKVYYNLSNQIYPSTVNFNEASEVVRELLVNSCKQHMHADVEVGISLSGGLDSSALLGCLELGEVLHKDVKCISADFGADLTEKSWISATARYHGLSTHIESFSPEEFYSYIKPMMWHLEAPLGGLMNCALTKIMKKASKSGIVVMQDGSGLDEAFGGYQNHHNIYIAELFKNGSYKAKKALQEYANNWGMDINSARFSVDSELKHNITSIDGTVPVRPDLLRPDFLSAHSIQLHSKRFESTGDAVRDAFIDYLQVSKIPRNMRMKDRTSMAFGIELRVPFLDHHLVEYALNLPPSFHFHQGYSKSVVRKALTGAMDEAVRLAPKRSIQAPQGLWLMQEPMRSYVENLINSESFADRGVFDVKKVKSSFEEFCSGKYDNSFFVWQWINLEEWFRIFIDNNSVEDVFSFR